MGRSSFTIVTAVASMLSATEALRIAAPSEGMAVVANRPYSVEWKGASDDSRFEIDLYYCGPYSDCSDDDDCGLFLANLCLEGDAGCVQEDGGYEVVMPEPVADFSWDGYRVRIAEVNGNDRVTCSDKFYLVSSADAPSVGEEGGPSMVVVEPSSDAVAIVGDVYTVKFDYDNGFGEKLGRFKIDLYKATSSASGDCGTWITSICDNNSIGCHDSQGDYIVVIPANIGSGMYSIRVGLFRDDSVYDCSEAFEVAASGQLLGVNM